MQGKQRAQFLAPSHVIPFAQYGRHHRSAETGVAAAVPSPAVGRDTEAGTAVPNPAGTGTAAVAKVEVGIVVASRVALAVEAVLPNLDLVGIEVADSIPVVVPETAGSNLAVARMVPAGPADSIPVAARAALAVAPNQIELATIGSSLAVVE